MRLLAACLLACLAAFPAHTQQEPETLAPFLTAKARGNFAGERAAEPKTQEN